MSHPRHIGRFTGWWMSRRLHPWGLFFGVALASLGLTPSLIPRTFFYQGLVCGVAAGVGYALGLALHKLWRFFLSSVLPATWRERLWKLRPSLGKQVSIEVFFTVVVVGVFIGWVYFSLRWQHAVARATGAQAYSIGEFLLVIPVAIAFFLLMIILGRCMLRLVDAIASVIPDHWADSVRQGLSWSLVIFVVLLILVKLIPGAIVQVGEWFYSPTTTADAGRGVPAKSERSGSEDSIFNYDDLGPYGQKFVSGGLHSRELAELTGKPAKEPIRAYGAIGSEPDSLSARANLLVDEMERLGAKDRKAMLLIVPTGTGWVDTRAAQAFELVHGGDTVVASVQYSALPSAIHFFAGGQEAMESGRTALTPILDWWNALDPEERPELYLYGESLGATVAESGFSGVRDMENSVDGMLMAGAPFFSTTRNELVARREDFSPEVKPFVDGGHTVRFAEKAGDVSDLVEQRSTGSIEWGPSRILYISHPSDPVAYWSPDLVFRKPDWLKEPAGFGRAPEMQWWPFLTSLQVTADLPHAVGVPTGYGHSYGPSMVPGFAAISVDELDPGEVARLATLLPKAMDQSGDSEWD